MRRHDNYVVVVVVVTFTFIAKSRTAKISLSNNNYILS